MLSKVLPGMGQVGKVRRRKDTLRAVLYCLLWVIALPATAVPVSAYIDARTQLLQLSPAERERHEHTRLLFAADTPLSQYFNLTSKVSADAGPALVVPQELITQLTDHPYVQLEAQILRQGALIREQEAPALDRLTELAEQARAQDWPRLERLATRMSVRQAIFHGYYFSAIMQIQKVVQMLAPGPAQADPFEYRLADAYLDLADIFYYLGDGNMSLKYCQFYQQYPAPTAQARISGGLCEVRARSHLQQYNTLWPLLASLKQQARQHQLAEQEVQLALATAKAYLKQEKYRLANEFASEARFVARYNQLRPMPGLDQYHAVEAAAALGLKQFELAQLHLEHMQDLLQTHRVNQARYHYQLAQLELQAMLYTQQGAYELANQLYRQMRALESARQQQFDVLEEVSAFTDKIHRQQLSYLALQATLNETRSDNMATLAAVASVFAGILLLLSMRLLHQKKRVEESVKKDPLTLLDARWYSLQQLQQILDSNPEVVSVALLDIDRFAQVNKALGSVAGDKVLSDVAAMIRAQAGPDDVVGRYGGEAFVLVLVNKRQHEAENVVERLRAHLGQTDFSRETTTVRLRFSCGLVSVRGKYHAGALMEECEELLQVAKARGRNQTRSKTV